MSGSQVVTGSHLIGRALELEGVDDIFTLAGDRILRWTRKTGQVAKRESRS